VGEFHEMVEVDGGQCKALSRTQVCRYGRREGAAVRDIDADFCLAKLEFHTATLPFARAT